MRYVLTARRGNEQAIRRAEKTVTAREVSYQDVSTSFRFQDPSNNSLQCIATTETLKRACRAVQSAHLYYTEAMNLLDTVCSPGRSGFMAALGDEQSKAETYKGTLRSPFALTNGTHSAQRQPCGRTRRMSVCRSA